MARFFADQVVETVIERTAARAIVQRLIDAVPGRDEDVSLLDRGWQLSLFEFREKHALDGVTRRLRKAMTSGGDPFDAFNSVQDHVLLAARAHIDRVILETFVAAIDRCPDESVAGLLSRLCDLHVLSMLERDRAWFLEHGRLTPARSKAIISAVNELCVELRPHAERLVEAFGIPDEVLAAPIALGDEERRQRAKGQPAGPEQP
jgi:acyl-CoA oxidase